MVIKVQFEGTGSYKSLFLESYHVRKWIEWFVEWSGWIEFDYETVWCSFWSTELGLGFSCEDFGLLIITC